ncbi:MAG TPA: peptidylprolyl isomerase [Gemmatimonadaceae bacterium]|nr:peptidylprolyl isomerase [Gemmatimonadaceae bacterium]
MPRDRAAVRRLALLASATLGLACTPWPFGDRRERPDPGVAVPDSFLVAFETSRGRFDVMARKNWAPVGVDRFYTLLESHYYDDVRFFRVVKNFVAQFGLSGDPRLNDAWRVRRIADEPVKHTNSRGAIAYARGGPGTRTMQIFVNLRDNPRLDTLNTFGFPPIAEVVSGMGIVDSLYSGYGEATPRTGAQPGRAGPSQDSISRQGNAYLVRGWPKLDYVKTARIVREWRSAPRDTAGR